MSDTPPCKQCDGGPVGWVEWREPSADGPDKEGWCGATDSDWDGNLFYTNLKFCPFCGRKLPDQPPPQTPAQNA